MVAQLTKLLKGVGKFAKQMYTCKPIVAETGKALSKGQKVANSVFNIMRKTAITTGVTSLVGTGVGICLGAYGGNTDNKELEQIGDFVSAKSLDIFASTLLGGFLGGPIGALLAAGLSYNTDHSMAGAVYAAVNSKTLDDAKNHVTECRELTYTKIKDILGINSTKDVPPEVQTVIDKFHKDLEDLINNGEPWTYVTVPNIEGLDMSTVIGSKEKPLEPNSLIIKTEEGLSIIPAHPDAKIEDIVSIIKFSYEFENFVENGEDGDIIIAPNVGKDLGVQLGENGKSITANDILVRKGDGFYIIKPDEKPYELIKASVEFENKLRNLIENGKVGDTVTTPDIDGFVYSFEVDGEAIELSSNNQIVRTDDGIQIIKPNMSQDNEGSGTTIPIRKIGSSAPVEMVVDSTYTATEDMRFLSGKNNQLVTVKKGQGYVCNPDSTVSVVEADVPKIAIRKIGSPVLVEYEVGKEYTAETDTKLLVGRTNKLVSIPAGKNFVCNADSTITIR